MSDCPETFVSVEHHGKRASAGGDENVEPKVEGSVIVVKQAVLREAGIIEPTHVRPVQLLAGHTGGWRRKTAICGVD